MEEFGMLLAVLFVILVCVLIGRLTKIETALGEIKEQLNEASKHREKIATECVKTGERFPEEVVTKEEKVVWPQVNEEVPVKEEISVAQELPAVEQLVVVEERPVIEQLPEHVQIVEEQTVAEVPQNVEAITKPAVPPVREVKKRKNINYEKFIGENLFGKIGILVFVIGIGLFVKYAIDKDWINETFRTVLGFLTGSVLLAIAERLQKKYRTFSSLLAGGAFAVFYLTVAIAFHYYHLFSQTVAFVILVGVTVFMSLLSILYDRRELAIISLVGGFLAPFIVGSGEGSYIILFTYISILNVGMFVLSIYKKWSVLPVISFAFTYLIMLLFLVNRYSTIDSLLNINEAMAWHLFVFSTLFYFIFQLPVFSILRVEKKKINNVLLSVIVANNFIYLGLGILFLKGMNLSFRSEGLLSLFIAIINLGFVYWLWKNKQDYKFLIYSMLGLVLTFVSITVPIQLDGNYITLFWASEMVLLLWLYVKSKIRVYEYASFILVCLTLISFLMDISNWVYVESVGIIFLNGIFATSLYMGLAVGAFALLMGHYRAFFATVRLLNYTPWNAFMLITSVIILYSTFIMEFFIHLEGMTASSAKLLFTTVSLFAVAFAFRKRFPLTKYPILYFLNMGVGVLIYVVNVWAVCDSALTVFPVLLHWIAVFFVIANLVYISRKYDASFGQVSGFVIYLNIVSTILWLAIVRSFLWQIGIEEFSAGFSLSLSAAGLVQMGLGMRLHQKMLRIISLFTFGIALLKLALVDLWALPTIGKIIVFIILGAILLVLSFLYQKLKDVLFKDDKDEAE